MMFGERVRSANWADLTKRLLLCARDGVARHAPADRRRFDVLSQAYVERAVRLLEIEDQELEASPSLFRILAFDLFKLINDDDEELDRIVKKADWEDVTRRVLAYTTRKHGAGATRAGKEPIDRVHEAVTVLLERRHHYPHYRGVSLVAFLCSTVDGIVSHDAEKLKNHGPHVRIVQGRGDVRTGDCAEDQLPDVEGTGSDVIAEKRTERFIASLEPELQAYARLCREVPGWTAKQFADALMMTVPQIRNLKRVLDRRRQKFDQDAG